MSVPIRVFILVGAALLISCTAFKRGNSAADQNKLDNISEEISQFLHGPRDQGLRVQSVSSVGDVIFVLEGFIGELDALQKSTTDAGVASRIDTVVFALELVIDLLVSNRATMWDCVLDSSCDIAARLNVSDRLDAALNIDAGAGSSSSASCSASASMSVSTGIDNDVDDLDDDSSSSSVSAPCPTPGMPGMPGNPPGEGNTPPVAQPPPQLNL